jgi:competence protein ComEC
LKVSLISALLFAAIISVKKWNSLRTDTIAFLDLRKHKGIVFKTGDHAVIVSDLADSDKTYKYSVQPYLDSCQVTRSFIVAPDSDINLPYLRKKAGLVGFMNKTLFIYAKEQEQISMTRKLKVNYLYMDNNTGISFIDRNFDYDALIIGTNKPKLLITKLAREADSLHINYIVPGRNKSVLTISN